MTTADREAFEALSFYTLTHGEDRFIHQHAVDAYSAQHPEGSKPIGVAFALIGLCLHVECGATGREVQAVHMALAKKRRPWPPLPPPAGRGEITVQEVLAAAPGAGRDKAIDEWCKSVWAAWGSRHETVRALIRERM